MNLTIRTGSIWEDSTSLFIGIPCDLITKSNEYVRRLKKDFPISYKKYLIGYSRNRTLKSSNKRANISTLINKKGNNAPIFSKLKIGAKDKRMYRYAVVMPCSIDGIKSYAKLKDTLEFIRRNHRSRVITSLSLPILSIGNLDKQKTLDIMIEEISKWDLVRVELFVPEEMLGVAKKMIQKYK